MTNLISQKAFYPLSQVFYPTFGDFKFWDSVQKFNFWYVWSIGQRAVSRGSRTTCFFLNDWSWLKVGFLKTTTVDPSESPQVDWNQLKPTEIDSNQLKLTQVDWTGSVDLSRFQLVWVGFSRLEAIHFGRLWMFFVIWNWLHSHSIGFVCLQTFSVGFRKPTFSQLQSFKKKQVDKVIRNFSHYRNFD